MQLTGYETSESVDIFQSHHSTKEIPGETLTVHWIYWPFPKTKPNN